MLSLDYMRSLYKTASDKKGDRETGKFYCNFTYHPEHHAIFLLMDIVVPI
jgi:hypothetical protein